MRAGDVRLTVDPRQGGRMASLRIGEREVLLTEGWGPIRWGCYPMAPFAGRIRDGRFTFRGRDVQLPLNLPPHAIHGTVFERPWEVVSQADDRARPHDRPRTGLAVPRDGDPIDRARSAAGSTRR